MLMKHAYDGHFMKYSIKKEQQSNRITALDKQTKRNDRRSEFVSFFFIIIIICFVFSVLECTVRPCVSTVKLLGTFLLIGS